MTTGNEPVAREYSFTVQPGDAGLRLDLWLSRAMQDTSRSRVQQLIKDGQVTVGGDPAGQRLKVVHGMTVAVCVPPPRGTEILAEDLPLKVLYEDDDIIAINKQPGLVVHPAAGHHDGTLVNALLFHCGDLQGIGGELRPGIVHRLDKDTSGAIVVAKNEKAMEGMVRQFKGRLITKEYLAVVHGIPVPARGEINTLVGRSRGDRKKMSARPGSGREAITHYEVIRKFHNACQVRLRIETGRTHQIRVHMAFLGHPVAGDMQYGLRRKDALLPAVPQRQMLHACFMSFKHPVTGAKIEINAPLWPDMECLLKALEKQL